MGRTKCADSSLVLRGGGRGGKGKERAGQNVQLRTGFDGRMDAPMRRMAIAFKQPFTLVHTTSRLTKKAPEKLSNTTPNEKSEKGRQVFWAKSLEGLHAMVPLNVADKFSLERNYNVPQLMELPSKIEVMAPSMAEDAATATLCSSIHSSEQNGTVLLGQQLTRKQIEENPFDKLDLTQPFVQIPMITEQDIAIQERRVLDARKRLQELRKSFTIR